MNNQKLNAKDFILTGVLTALMWIIFMIISTVMSVLGPVTNVFYPPVVAIPNGIVMMLLLAKVPKRGVLTICGVIQAVLTLVVGMFWFGPIALIVGGIICDFLIMNRKEITTKSMIAAYAIFSGIFTFGAMGPIKFLQSAYVAATEKNDVGQEYINGLIRMTSVPMLMVIIAAGLAGGWLGALLGQKMLRKHFVKAGLVSVK
ncbi:MAG: MptD family putative ECF transporter S component [Lachnospiraceae bacterium]